jgi:hypothetical protein
VRVALLLVALASGFVAAFLLLRPFTHGFKDWRFSEKVGAAQAVLPFAAAAFALNALFGESIETLSKIVAGVFTLLAGLLAIVKQVAATIESHRGVRTAMATSSVSFGEVVKKIWQG